MTNSGDPSLTFNLTDLLFDEGVDHCILSMNFVLKDTGFNDQVEGVTIGYTYFQRYSGIHYDFENFKVAFSGDHDFKPLPPGPNNQQAGLSPVAIVFVVILSIVGLGAIGTAIWCIKKKKIQSGIKEYERLSGNV